MPSIWRASRLAEIENLHVVWVYKAQLTLGFRQ